MELLGMVGRTWQIFSLGLAEVGQDFHEGCKLYGEFYITNVMQIGQVDRSNMQY